MKPSKYLGLLCLVLVVGFVAWGVNQSVAQTKQPQHKKPAVQKQAPVQPSITTQGPAGPVKIGGQTLITGQRTIIDAAGRPHVRSERIPYAQRRAAAQRRLQALRQAAANKRQGEVKK
jgi:hypothetical protein